MKKLIILAIALTSMAETPALPKLSAEQELEIQRANNLLLQAQKQLADTVNKILNDIKCPNCRIIQDTRGALLVVPPPADAPPAPTK